MSATPDTALGRDRTAMAGTFLIALATLALEVTLTRLLSVTTWYSLAFFCIATALLGMTAGATRVYLRPERFAGEALPRSTARACLGFAIVTPISLAVLCVLPLGLWVDALSLLLSLIATLTCCLPFYFSGVAVTAALTRYDFAPGRIYAADLIGASLGCLLVLAGLEILDAPSLILVCGAIGGVAALQDPDGVAGVPVGHLRDQDAPAHARARPRRGLDHREAARGRARAADRGR